MQPRVEFMSDCMKATIDLPPSKPEGRMILVNIADSFRSIDPSTWLEQLCIVLLSVQFVTEIIWNVSKSSNIDGLKFATWSTFPNDLLRWWNRPEYDSHWRSHLQLRSTYEELLLFGHCVKDCHHLMIELNIPTAETVLHRNVSLHMARTYSRWSKSSIVGQWSPHTLSTSAWAVLNTSGYATAASMEVQSAEAVVSVPASNLSIHIKHRIKRKWNEIDQHCSSQVCHIQIVHPEFVLVLKQPCRKHTILW